MSITKREIYIVAESEKIVHCVITERERERERERGRESNVSKR